MGGRHVCITYPKNLLQQPVIYEMGRDFRLTTNILHANITTEHGWIELEVTGEDSNILSAIAALRPRGMVADVHNTVLLQIPL